MKYIINSLKHGTARNPRYWGPDQNGYTDMLVKAGIYDEDEARRIVRRLSENEAELLPVNAALAKKARRQVKKKQERTQKQIMYIQRQMAADLMQLNHELDGLELAELDTWSAE